MEGLEIRELNLHEDERGWLGEILRADTSPLKPLMAYLSMTRPGTARGPHEHREQTDFFCFLGRFRLYLWDNRKSSATYGEKKVIDTSRTPTLAVVPPGVVHAYRNIDSAEAFVINLPDKLYRGWGRTEAVDEVRYEDDSASSFRLGE